jgi:hypothetical protein
MSASSQYYSKPLNPSADSAQPPCLPPCPPGISGSPTTGRCCYSSGIRKICGICHSLCLVLFSKWILGFRRKAVWSWLRDFWIGFLRFFVLRGLWLRAVSSVFCQSRWKEKIFLYSCLLFGSAKTCICCFAKK